MMTFQMHIKNQKLKFSRVPRLLGPLMDPLLMTCQFAASLSVPNLRLV
jgi:hypothetical protein